METMIIEMQEDGSYTVFDSTGNTYWFANTEREAEEWCERHGLDHVTAYEWGWQ